MPDPSSIIGARRSLRSDGRHLQGLRRRPPSASASITRRAPTPDGGVLLAGGLGKFGPIDDIYKIDRQHAGSIGKLPGAALGRRRRHARRRHAAHRRRLHHVRRPAAAARSPPTRSRRRRRRHDRGGAALAARLRRRHPPRPTAACSSPAASTTSARATTRSSSRRRSQSFATLSPSSGRRATMLSPAHRSLGDAVAVGRGVPLRRQRRPRVGRRRRAVVARRRRLRRSADLQRRAAPASRRRRARRRHGRARRRRVVAAARWPCRRRCSTPSSSIRRRPGATGVLDDLDGETSARAEATATALADGSVLYVGGARRQSAHARRRRRAVRALLRRLPRGHAVAATHDQRDAAPSTQRRSSGDDGAAPAAIAQPLFARGHVDDPALHRLPGPRASTMRTATRCGARPDPSSASRSSCPRRRRVKLAATASPRRMRTARRRRRAAGRRAVPPLRSARRPRPRSPCGDGAISTTGDGALSSMLPTVTGTLTHAAAPAARRAAPSPATS